ncbi:SDR family NAD(P)-dependent oxidoreductase [Salinarimonas rosea]|uniref:SDR family NAD(P)-dependent oxidoreductase n=1 Tax=Salinarimonas rosea TaxID=552063 RepID=UPI00042262C8|nr:SDR family NAD(P)-dependent oxidoreductase [Salinarimonas rosea]
MTPRLKPLAHQIVVVTGAAGGVGRAVAREAASAGARLVLVGGDGAALTRVAGELAAGGARAVIVEADASEPDDARRVAQVADATYGGFDTWVATAPTALAGAALATGPAEQRRIFDRVYWSAAHGAIEAARHLRRRGGAIVVVGGGVAERALAETAPYAAARGAIAAFVGGLRRELAAERAPVSVTLVRPSAVDGPGDAARLDDAISAYDPALVARAALFAAEHPRRTLVVGAGGHAADLVDRIAPGLGGGLARRMARAVPHRDTSLALEAQLHPGAAAAIALGTGLIVAGLAWALARVGEGAAPGEAGPVDRRWQAWRAARPMRAERAAAHPMSRPRPPITRH